MNTTEINIDEQLIEVNITNEIVTIETPSGAYPIPSGLPRGGTEGQFLVKKNSTDYQAEWKTIVDHYVHNQENAQIEWNVTHNLGKFPSVSVVDSANDEVIGEVTYIDTNSLTIKFTAAFSGKAYLN